MPPVEFHEFFGDIKARFLSNPWPALDAFEFIPFMKSEPVKGNARFRLVARRLEYRVDLFSVQGFSHDKSLLVISHTVPALLGRWSRHASPVQVIPNLAIARKRIFPAPGDYL